MLSYQIDGHGSIWVNKTSNVHHPSYSEARQQPARHKAVVVIIFVVSADFRKVTQISTEGVLFFGPENCEKYNQKMQKIHVKGVHPVRILRTIH